MTVELSHGVEIPNLEKIYLERKKINKTIDAILKINVKTASEIIKSTYSEANHSNEKTITKKDHKKTNRHIRFRTSEKCTCGGMMVTAFIKIIVDGKRKWIGKNIKLCNRVGCTNFLDKNSCESKIVMSN